MPTCSKCGATISESNSFCGKCGAKAVSDTIKCPKCGQSIKADSKFCGKCGNPINQRIEISAEPKPLTITPTETSSHFVQAKCTNCAAHLEVDSSKDAAICPYCGTPYVVEKAIKNYNISNNITAGVVNIIGDSASDFEIVGGVLKKYKGASTNVTIPNTVTIIGEQAFKDCIGITSVVIPDTVVQINKEAFNGCKNLQKVTMPNIKEIGYEAFYMCANLQNVVLPNSLKTLGAQAFSGCSKLQDIVLPTSLESIGACAFYSCFLKGTIRLPETITKVDISAFAKCPDLKIIWPVSWANKTIRKLRIAAHTADYCFRSFPEEKAGTYTLLISSDHHTSFGIDYIEYCLFEKDGFVKAKNIHGYVYDQLSSDLQGKYNVLMDLYNRAGISNPRIETVSIPKYEEKYNKWAGKHVTKQTGSIQALQVTIVQE